MALPERNIPYRLQEEHSLLIPSEVIWVPEIPRDQTLAIISPGQGSQKVGMGKDLTEWSPAAAGVWQMGRDILGDAFIKTVWEGPEEELAKTSITQPAVALDSLARMATLQEMGKYDNAGVYTGNSLGFYPAMVNAGALSLEDGIRLIQLRGQISEIQGVGESAMIAVADADEVLPEELQEQFGLYLCLDNTKKQKVFGGDKTAVADAKTWMVEKRGLTRVYPLAIDRAFHSPYMEPAVAPLRHALNQIDIHAPTKGQLIGICDVRPLTNRDEIIDELLTQLTSTVRWKDNRNYLFNQKVTTMVELNGSPTLTAMAADENELGGDKTRIAPERQEGRGRPPTIVYVWTAPQAA